MSVHLQYLKHLQSRGYVYIVCLSVDVNGEHEELSKTYRIYDADLMNSMSQNQTGDLGCSKCRLAGS